MHVDDAKWYALSREQQRAETDAKSELFLGWLDRLSEESPADDRPGYHGELIAEIRRLRALVAALEGVCRNHEETISVMKAGLMATMAREGLLRTYARHHNNCDIQKHPCEGGNYACSCGLVRLIP